MKLLLAILLCMAIYCLPDNTPVLTSNAVAHKKPESIKAQVAPQPTQPVQATPQVVTPQPLTHEQMMDQAGISKSDQPAVDYIISHESGWCPTKWEGEIGYCPDYHGFSTVGYGLCQSTPAIKMAIAGEDWATNPVTQLKWCSLYATSRYGGWWASYNHWIASHNW